MYYLRLTTKDIKEAKNNLKSIMEYKTNDTITKVVQPNENGTISEEVSPVRKYS